jgi:hypothetical protein
MGPTEVLTAEGYIVESADIILDNSKNSIVSNKKTIIKDIDGNKNISRKF